MNEPALDRERIALGIRQPWAELILRGIKTVEVRSTGTRQRGTIYIYASKKIANDSFAEEAISRHGLDLANLPMGMLVGSVEVIESRPAELADEASACVSAEYLEGRFAWRLESPVRLAVPVAPKFLPFGVWFYPFRRRSAPGT